MAVAELAKRFETTFADETKPDTPGLAPGVGRVKELTRRLEEAVIDNGTEDFAIGAPQETTDSSKPTQPPPRVEEASQQRINFTSPPPASTSSSSNKQSPAPVFPSPPLLPNVSRARSNNHASPSSSGASRVSPSRPLPQVTANVPTMEDLSSASKIISSAQISYSTQNTSPAQLSVSERLAVYEQLTTASELIPTPNQAPTTPSTVFSSNSSVVSSQRHGPIDLIPDVSEGDLDDIEGVERVDDEGSMYSTPCDDDNATFRRAKTVQTLPTTDSQSSHHTAKPSDPPSRPSTSSNASENSSFSSAEFASAIEEFQADRPAPHTLAVPLRTAPRHESNLSTQPHTLQIAPGSFKKLPKAKVMIARRRGHEAEKDDPGTSNDEMNTRKLIREYEHPKELLEGSVSLVELSDDDDEHIDFRDPEVSDVRRETSIVQKKKNRAEAFRHRYDEFMDPQEIEHVNEVPVEEVNASNSKERYQRRRLFRRGKVEKARQREERLARQKEAVARRSTVISGAIDRVSLAADPWIDFITDTNTLPVAKAGGGLKRGLKKLFGFGRQNAGLIKTGK